MTPPIYLDYAATTPLDARVLAVMEPYFSVQFGNPSSIHAYGRAALAALDAAHETIAEVLGANPREIILTGGGSEADNLAIKGVALAQRQAGKGGHVIVSAIEHHAVLHAVEYLAAFGFESTILPVDSTGLLHPDVLRAAIRPDTSLVSVMYANNEIGTIQSLADLGAVCRERGVLFHTDAVQAPGQLPLDVNALRVDLMTIAAHKFYGPKGIGALYVRRGTPLLPQINGGGQERRRRAGTEDVAGAVGMAEALRLAEAERGAEVLRLTVLRDRLIAGVLATIPDARLNGHPTLRLPNNTNFGIPGTDGESLLILLDQYGIAASSGSACTSGSLSASHVLLALGQTPELAVSALRLTLGRSTTAAEVDRVLEVLPQVVGRLRGA